VFPDDLRRRLESAARGVVVAGDGLDPTAAQAVATFAERRGWPLLAEPHSNARRGATALRSGDALLLDARFTAANAPDLVLVAGRPGLSRALLGWLPTTRHVVLDPDGRWLDPTRSAESVWRCDPAALDGVTGPRADAAWTAAWVGPAQRVADAVDALLDAGGLTEPRVARDLVAGIPPGSALVVASSMPIRDLDLTMRPRGDVRIVANRGVSGIDGFVSTAVGVALAHDGPVYALAGDLSLLHDVNGLAVDRPPDLTVVVVNNDGGGIFSVLPQAAETDRATFERLFGTPHGLDLAGIARGYGAEHVLATSPAELDAQLTVPTGLRIVEVRTERAGNAALHRDMRAEAARILASGPEADR
jgi:2-succinyl-5-enolpyruvyl-6-hydroxy-3-cyclohexene-1-carboxylate synthase